MDARLTSRTLIGALRRRVEAAGGHAMVLAKGDETSGAVLVQLVDRGAVRAMVERGMAPDGSYKWVEAGPSDKSDPKAMSDYVEKRRRFDPDLWLVEVDLPPPDDWLDEFVGAAAR